MSFKGKLNVYTCQTCRGEIVTRDLDDGTTPFMVGCRATRGCTGLMRSGMYNVDQTQTADYEWYKPSPLEVLAPPAYHHVKMGGLLLRPVARAGGA